MCIEFAARTDENVACSPGGMDVLAFQAGIVRKGQSLRNICLYALVGLEKNVYLDCQQIFIVLALPCLARCTAMSNKNCKVLG